MCHTNMSLTLAGVTIKCYCSAVKDCKGIMVNINKLSGCASGLRW